MARTNAEVNGIDEERVVKVVTNKVINPKAIVIYRNPILSSSRAPPFFDARDKPTSAALIAGNVSTIPIRAPPRSIPIPRGRVICPCIAPQTFVRSAPLPAGSQPRCTTNGVITQYETIPPARTKRPFLPAIKPIPRAKIEIDIVASIYEGKPSNSAKSIDEGSDHSIPGILSICLRKNTAAAIAAAPAMSVAFRIPSDGERRIAATAVPLGNRSRSISIICRRRGITNPTPSSEPAIQANASCQNLNSTSGKRNKTGAVKTTPPAAVFIPEATVCAMLFSRTVPRRRIPRSTPQPRMAATVEPLVEKPSFIPA